MLWFLPTRILFPPIPNIYPIKSGSGVLPTLSYAGNPQNAFYTIAGSWVDASLALDSMNWLYNNKLNIINYGGTDALDIDSLLIPGSKTLKFRATAVLDKTAPEGKYDNRASIVYHKLVQTKPEKQMPLSLEL
ncbi:hypothetical protein FACS189413_16720 [Bacteroidia bacterium]|nr:hypothetical protein FACS189413_16720 [Bacteroidia bacterium]